MPDEPRADLPEGWIAHDGSERPVAWCSRPKVQFRDGFGEGCFADAWDWSQIIAYRPETNDA